MLNIHDVKQPIRVDCCIIGQSVGGFIVSESSGANVISDHYN